VRPPVATVLRFVVAIAGAVFALAPGPVAATEAMVIAPETPIRSAPFDVAPELGRAHANDRLPVQGEPSGDWRRVRLPDGRFGYLRASAVTLTADSPPVAKPVSIEPAQSAAPNAPATDPAPDAPAVAPAPNPPPGAPAPTLPVLTAAGTTPTASAARPGLLGVMFEILPVGTLVAKSSIANQNANASTDGVFAVAVAPFYDVAVSRYLSLGGSPQVVFRVKGDGVVGQSATEFDLRARVTGRVPMSPRVAVFGRLSPAYSILALPSAAPPSASPSNPAGFLLDLAVGSEVALLPDLFLVIDLGYQVGFQSMTASDGSSFDGTRYLHLGAGLAIGL
jgi:hypothetical protein